MDVVRWKVSLKRFSDDFSGEPGLCLTVELKCRVCEEKAVHSSAVTIRPREVALGHRVNWGVDTSTDWFRFAVEHRLGVGRNCSECGYSSVIPKRARTQLMLESDAEVTQVWLFEGLQTLGLTICQKPGRQIDEEFEAYSSRTNKQRVIEQEWHDFALAPAS